MLWLCLHYQGWFISCHPLLYALAVSALPGVVHQLSPSAVCSGCVCITRDGSSAVTLCCMLWLCRHYQGWFISCHPLLYALAVSALPGVVHQLSPSAVCSGCVGITRDGSSAVTLCCMLWLCLHYQGWIISCHPLLDALALSAWFISCHPLLDALAVSALPGMVHQLSPSAGCSGCVCITRDGSSAVTLCWMLWLCLHYQGWFISCHPLLYALAVSALPGMDHQLSPSAVCSGCVGITRDGSSAVTLCWMLWLCLHYQGWFISCHPLLYALAVSALPGVVHQLSPSAVCSGCVCITRGGSSAVTLCCMLWLCLHYQGWFISCHPLLDALALSALPGMVHQLSPSAALAVSALPGVVHQLSSSAGCSGCVCITRDGSSAVTLCCMLWLCLHYQGWFISCHPLLYALAVSALPGMVHQLSPSAVCSGCVCITRDGSSAVTLCWMLWLCLHYQGWFISCHSLLYALAVSALPGMVHQMSPSAGCSGFVCITRDGSSAVTLCCMLWLCLHYQGWFISCHPLLDALAVSALPGMVHQLSPSAGCSGCVCITRDGSSAVTLCWMLWLCLICITRDGSSAVTLCWMLWLCLHYQGWFISCHPLLDALAVSALPGMVHQLSPSAGCSGCVCITRDGSSAVTLCWMLWLCLHYQGWFISCHPLLDALAVSALPGVVHQLSPSAGCSGCVCITRDGSSAVTLCWMLWLCLHYQGWFISCHPLLDALAVSALPGMDHQLSPSAVCSGCVCITRDGSSAVTLCWMLWLCLHYQGWFISCHPLLYALAVSALPGMVHQLSPSPGCSGCVCITRDGSSAVTLCWMLWLCLHYQGWFISCHPLLDALAVSALPGMVHQLSPSAGCSGFVCITRDGSSAVTLCCMLWLCLHYQGWIISCHPLLDALALSALPGMVHQLSPSAVCSGCVCITRDGSSAVTLCCMLWLCLHYQGWFISCHPLLYALAVSALPGMVHQLSPSAGCSGCVCITRDGSSAVTLCWMLWLCLHYQGWFISCHPLAGCSGCVGITSWLCLHYQGWFISCHPLLYALALSALPGMVHQLSPSAVCSGFVCITRDGSSAVTLCCMLWLCRHYQGWFISCHPLLDALALSALPGMDHQLSPSAGCSGFVCITRDGSSAVTLCWMLWLCLHYQGWFISCHPLLDALAVSALPGMVHQLSPSAGCSGFVCITRDGSSAVTLCWMLWLCLHYQGWIISCHPLLDALALSALPGMVHQLSPSAGCSGFVCITRARSQER